MEEQINNLGRYQAVFKKIIDTMEKQQCRNISVMGITNCQEDCGLYCGVSSKHVFWRFERGEIKIPIGVWFVKLQDGTLVYMERAGEILEIKKRIWEKIPTKKESAKQLMSKQQELIEKLMTELQAEKAERERTQKRLAALEARGIERDLGAEG